MQSLEAVLKLGYDIAQSEETTIAGLKNNKRNPVSGGAAAIHSNSGGSGTKLGNLNRHNSPQAAGPGVRNSAGGSGAHHGIHATSPPAAPSSATHPKSGVRHQTSGRESDRFAARKASPTGSSGSGGAVPNNRVAAPIQRSSMTKVPGHTPHGGGTSALGDNMISNNSVAINANNNRGKFARLAKPPPPKVSTYSCS